MMKRKELIHSPLPGLVKTPSRIKGVAFINLKTMNLLKLKTGFPIKLSSSINNNNSNNNNNNNNKDSSIVSFFGFAWPSAKVQENQICLDLILRENCQIKVGEHIVVESIQENSLLECEKINVMVDDGMEWNQNHHVDMMEMDPSLLQIIFNQQQLNRIFIPGNIFFVSVCGRPRRIKVKECTSSISTKDIEGVYQVTQQTQFIIEYKKEDDEKEKEIETEAKEELAFSSIGGLKNQLKVIKESVDLAIKDPESLLQYGLKPPKGILLYGPPGTGKTLIARVIAAQSKANITVINGPEFLSSFLGESEAKLRKIFEDAEKNSPSFIFIDELDAVCGARNEDSSEMEKRITGTFLTLLDGINSSSNSPRIFVMGATNRPDSLDPALRRPGRFDKEVEISIPNIEERLEIIRLYLKRMPHKLSDEEIVEIANKSHGYVGADLAALCKEAGLKSLKRVVRDSKCFLLDQIAISFSDISLAMNEITPSAMREVVIEVPKVFWSDIGGYEDVKQKLKENVEMPIKHPEAFQRMGVDPPKGLLLYGPPGCSKTLMAKALATEAGINFIAVKGPELFNKFVGQSERAVREIFRKARAASPSIIFFDEMDALAGKREEGESVGVTDRVISQIIVEMNGIESLSSVSVIGATNRPDMMDNSLLAPGRFDRIIYVSPPNEAARTEIFKIHLQKTPHSKEISPSWLASLTEGFSGAECSSLTRDASMKALEEDLNATQIEKHHFQQAVFSVTPAITKEMIDFYQKWSKQ